jgi:hypothetical protein
MPLRYAQCERQQGLLRFCISRIPKGTFEAVFVATEERSRLCALNGGGEAAAFGLVSKDD